MCIALIWSKSLPVTLQRHNILHSVSHSRLLAANLYRFLGRQSPPLPCERDTTSCCLFMPTGLRLKTNLHRLTGQASQTHCSKTVYRAPRNVCCPEGRLKRVEKSGRPYLSLHISDLLCVTLEQPPQNSLCWHLKFSKRSIVHFFETPSLESWMKQWSTMFSQDFALPLL